MRQLAVGLSTILAPLWAGGLWNNLMLNFGVMLSLIGLGLVRYQDVSGTPVNGISISNVCVYIYIYIYI